MNKNLNQNENKKSKTQNEQKLVALKYPKNAEAPFIVAKSKGHLTQKLLKIAQENKIPIVQDDFCANILSTQEIGECINEQTWEIIAKIFAFVVENNNKM